MSNGMAVYNPAGVERLGIFDSLTRVIHRQALGKNESGSVSLPGFVASKGVAFAVSTDYLLLIPHTVNAVAGVVSWSPGTDVLSKRANSQLVVISYG